MIITTIVTMFFSLIIEWLVSGATFIASEILGDTIALFDGDIFQNVINQMPVLTQIHAYSIIRGIGLGLAVMLIVWAAVKSIASPLIGEDQPNVANVIIRGAIAMLLLAFFYANTYEGTTQSGFRFGGFISLLGQLFGNVLTTISNSISNGVGLMPLAGQEYTLEILKDATHYLAWCVLAASLLTSVVGAAMTILERVITLAITALIGPVAIAMYANPATADTFKQWLLSLITQFIALFISMIMWIAFMAQMNSAFKESSLFSIALTVVILTLVKNSEKILHSFGLRTMNMGDSARAMAAGFGVLASGAGLAMTAGNMAANIRQNGTLTRTAGGLGGNRGSNQTMGVQNVLSGEIGKNKLFAGTQRGRNVQRALGNAKTVLTTWNPRAIANMRKQNSAYSTLFDSNNKPLNNVENAGEKLNDLLGLDSTSEVRFGNDMKYAEYTGTTIDKDGKEQIVTMQGYQGTAEFNGIDGEIVRNSDVFVPLTNNGINVSNSSFDNSKIIDNFGTRIYMNPSEPNLPKAAPEKKVEVSSEIFEAKN